MKEFINLLERKIEGCDALGGLEREKAVYQSVLKDYKKQLNLCGVVKRYRPKDGNDALRFLKENKEIEVANIVAFDMAKILEENTDYLFSFKKNLWNKGWTGFKIK